MKRLILIAPFVILFFLIDFVFANEIKVQGVVTSPYTEIPCAASQSKMIIKTFEGDIVYTPKHLKCNSGDFITLYNRVGLITKFSYGFDAQP